MRMGSIDGIFLDHLESSHDSRSGEGEVKLVGAVDGVNIGHWYPVT